MNLLSWKQLFHGKNCQLIMQIKIESEDAVPPAVQEKIILINKIKGFFIRLRKALILLLKNFLQIKIMEFLQYLCQFFLLSWS